MNSGAPDFDVTNIDLEALAEYTGMAKSETLYHLGLDGEWIDQILAGATTVEDVYALFLQTNWDSTARVKALRKLAGFFPKS